MAHALVTNSEDNDVLDNRGEYSSDYLSKMATASHTTEGDDAASLFDTNNAACDMLLESQNVEKNEPSEEVRQYLSKKTAWVSPNEKQFDALVGFVQKRLDEGHGETILEIGTGAVDCDCPGLLSDEMEASVATLTSMASVLNSEIQLLREKTLVNNTKFIKEFLIRRHIDEEDFMEVRIAVVGNVDAGKSTLLGVLTHGVLDDGRGMARMKLFRHKHEMETGRTSSVGNDILGFDAKGNIVNKPDTHGTQALDWTSICQKSAKVVTFIDLAGHEKYLKTTVFGMTGHAPDFAMLMIGSNMGIVGMTKEHLGLALALNVPVFVIVTKIDMCPPNVLQETLKLLQKILRSPGCRKIPMLVQTNDDVVTCATNFTSERLCPIFQVSNVTGQNLDILKTFLNLLSTRMESYVDEPAEFQIDDLYSVPGVGTVVSGTTLKGVIKLNDTLLLGPDALGQYKQVQIRSIHRKRMPVRQCQGGQTASFALKRIKKSELRKGMVLLSTKLKPEACWEFEADVLVLHHPTTISIKYQAMVHCGSIRQTAQILSMSVEHMRTGDRATVKFRFIKNAEYLRPNMKLVFREGRTKAIGTISKLYTQVAAQPMNSKIKSVKMQQSTTDGSQQQSIKRVDNSSDTSAVNKRSKQTKPREESTPQEEPAVQQ
ncbi:unnamed protein product [Didymodactylos carnosus]|uniref:GTP-binding protein 1 n=1 Tax=Didymodactylos carnosus TaxID=1234261 RepID=A0A813UZQ4_9BILA|nr:unnamed protein product [Didymodactylos carnosus]CAF1015561.1 unnamed protein product [Didymodactylos carnosus]CAF3622209.1 unnamed protein product [Didymodactylos carnosus]CAF3784590.1 unnamed protein product [Didymodactylos carnosus]